MGIEEALRNVTAKFRLHYNVILERKLNNPIIIYFIPLLIILFSIYAVLLVSYRGHDVKKDIFTSLSSFTALFFTLIILHQTLRSQYQSGELLYIEYFFFFTYISILLLILHSLIVRVSRYSSVVNKYITPYLRIFFWPLQFGAWFVVTMIVFYTFH